MRAECAQTAEGVTIRLTGAVMKPGTLGQPLADSLFVGSSTPVGSGGYGVKGVEAYGDVYEVDGFPQQETGSLIVTGGTLRVKVSTDVWSSSPIAGNGRLWFSEGTPSATREVVAPTTLPANSSWITVLPAADLKDVVLTGGDMTGGWVDAAPACTPYHAATQADGSIIVQLQRLSWNAGRCVRVQLRQNGGNVEAKGIDSYGASNVQLGSDATKWGNPNTGFKDGGYIISNLKFSRSGPYGVALQGTKTWQGGTKIDGVRLGVLNSIMPDRSTVKVTNGGILQLSAENVFDHYPCNTYDLAPGTQLFIDAFDAVNCGDKVIADAAAVKVISDHRAYLNDLTLKNGATLSGHTVRVGNTGAAVWRTSGELPISISTSIETVRYGTDPMTFDVGADIVLAGNIWEFSSRERMPLVKAGNGCLTLGGNVTSTANLTLNGGTTVLNGNLTAAGLVLADDSTLEIAAGKTAMFGDSSALAWTAGKLLNLVGAFDDADRTLRIGTTAAALTRPQLKAIRIGSMRAFLDDEGWLHRRWPGIAIFIR